MKFSRLGFVFKYHFDEVVRHWPWTKRPPGVNYASSLLSLDFNNFKEYKKALTAATIYVTNGDPGRKLLGTSMVDLLSIWSSIVFRNEYVIAMVNVDPQARSQEFWSSIPESDKKHLLSDVVVLRCKDESEMNRLIDSFSLDFAEAYGFYQGRCIASNDKRYE